MSEHIDSRSWPQHARGFSLIELLTAVTILAILLSLGLPSFLDSMRSNRVATGANDVMVAIMLARSEALKNNRNATVCATDNPAVAVPTCGTNWNAGWFVWVDRDRNGSVTDAGEVVRAQVGNPNISILGGAPAAVATFSFDARGRRTAPAAAGDSRLDLQPDTCPTGKRFVRYLYVSPSGRPRITDQNLTFDGYAVCA